MSSSHAKVLVLGSDTRSFLTVIRSLGRAGKVVDVAWCARDSVSVSSRFVNNVHRIKRPTSNGWESELKQLLDREQYDLVIPCNDPSILPLHDCRSYFANYPIYLVEESIFDTVMDKSSVNTIASRAGVRLPREVLIQNPGEIDAIDELSGPLVLKPTRSYVNHRLNDKNEVIAGCGHDSARVQIQEMLQFTPVAVQEFFDGYGVGVEFIANKGQVLTSFQHARLHEPPDGGGSSYRKSCPLNPELETATAALVRSLNYTGIGMAEYRYNDQTHDWIFVEINSRFWGSLPLAVNCGADFPVYLYDLLCAQRTEFPNHYAVNRTCRNWLRDVQWLRSTVASNGLAVGKQMRLLGQLIWELRYPLTFRESSDTLSWDDREPGLRELREAARGVPLRLRRKASAALWKTKTWRSHARGKVHRKLANAKNVLFVCKGNICRSPFAEALGRSLHEGWKVESRGYFPKEDRTSPEHALAAASSFSVDLSGHRSRVLSDVDIDWADIILIFDEENRVEVTSQFPAARSKTFKLGALVECDDPDIADPYGGSIDDFRSIYEKIRRALNSIHQ